MTPMTINQNELELNLIYDKLAFTLFIPKSKRLPLLNRMNDPQFYRPFNRKVYLITHNPQQLSSAQLVK